MLSRRVISRSALGLGIGALAVSSPAARVSLAQAHPTVSIIWSRPTDSIIPLTSIFDAAPLPDGNVVLLDNANQRAYIVDRSGSQIAQFGGLGGGPGELQNVRDLGIDLDGSILLADGGTRRIQRWDAKGKYLGIVDATPLWHFLASGPGGVYLRTRPPLIPPGDGKGPLQAQMWLRNLDTLSIERSGRFRLEWTEDQSNQTPGEFCWYCPAVPMSMDTLVVGYWGPGVELGLQDREGRVLRKIELSPYSAVSYSASEIASATRTWVRRTGRLGTVPDYLSHPKPGLTTNAVGVDARHRIWIRPTTSEAEGTRLIAFDATGRIVFDSHLPYPASQLRVNGNWIALLGERTSDDAPVVTLLEIRQ